MERATIKTAIDILDQINIADAFDEQLIINVAETLEQCGNEIARLQAKLAIAKEALRETTIALEHRWEVIANRAAPVMESVIDAAHTKGIEALAQMEDK